MARWLQRAALVVSLVYGCGHDLQPLQIVNQSEYPEWFARSVITNVEATAGVSIDLDGYTLFMRAHVGQGCIAPDASACSLQPYQINAPFPQPSEWDVGTEETTGRIAALLCHELGHVHYFAETGDAHNYPGHNNDPVWFDVNNPNSVCGKVRAQFTAEIDL